MSYKRLMKIQNFLITRLWITVAVLTAFMTTDSEASKFHWGNIGDTGNSQTVSFGITNNDQGTEYNFFVLNSVLDLMDRLYQANSGTYSSMQEMINGTDSYGNPNFRLGINSDSGYVNNGWRLAFNSNGGIEGVNLNDRNSDDFLYNQIFSGDITVSDDLLQGNPLKLAENTQGLIDSAIDGGGNPYSFQSDWIPVPEPTINLSTMHVNASVNTTNTISLNIAPTHFYPSCTNLRFRIATATNLSSGGWITNTTLHSITGAVTAITLTNSHPQAFFKIIKP